MLPLNELANQLKWKNWGENEERRFQQLVLPSSIEEVQQLVIRAKAAQQRIRVIGASHSFSAVAAPDDLCVSLHHMRGLVSLNKATNEVTLWAGTYLHEIGPLLKQHGLALANMGDIQEQTIAGAVSTGTHGTGITLGSISSQVTVWEWVDGNGQLHRHARGDDDLSRALNVSLGLLGILVRITIQAVPLYSLAVTTFKALAHEQLLRLHEDVRHVRHLEWFYFPHTDYVQVKQMQMVTPQAKPFTQKMIGYVNKVWIENNAFYLLSEMCRRNPQRCVSISQFSANAIPNGKEVGYSYEMYASPRKVKFLEAEYAIPFERFSDCFQEVMSGIRHHQFAVHFPIEVRFAKGEAGFLNANAHPENAFLAFHMYKGMAHEAYFAWVYETMAKYGGRPHWGKMNDLTADTMKQRYPHWEQFLALREAYDPNDIFINAYFAKLLRPVAVL